MNAIASASVTSPASPAAVFRRWEDMATWPEWNSDTEWVRRDGPFAEGTRGVLKPKGGPRVKFVIDKLVPEREFVDVSLLPGARLVFRHVVTPVDGGSRVEVDVSITGATGWVWRRLLGKGFRTSAQRDLEGLVAAAQQCG